MLFERPTQQSDRVVLVHVAFNSFHQEELAEFRELIIAAGGEIVSEVLAKRDKPSPKYFVGLGKAEEISSHVNASNAELVIFNHELSPAQERNLEKLLNCRVLDRTGLILDIFAQRARSFEGKLQVELAQLQHMVTRLVRGWTHLERQKGGIGLRGPGETQLETDRRLIRQRISSIEKRLQKVHKQRDQGRRSRKKATVPTVSLVGYTNAGKSTLFNFLTQSEVYVADQLFATLDPTLREVKLPGFGRVILADTVGFVRQLPHDLVAAFRATLEETRNADLLIHVIDASDPVRRDKIDQVEEVLKEIGAEQVPSLQVFNKIDLLENATAHVDSNEQQKPERVWFSAKTGEGLPLLKDAIAARLCQEFVYCSMLLHPKEGCLRAKLHELKAVLSEQLRGNDFILELRLPRIVFERIVN